MPKQGEGMTLGNTEVKFLFLTTHKTITHKLFHSPRSYFCIVTAVLVATRQRDDLHLLRTGLSLLSLL